MTDDLSILLVEDSADDEDLIVREIRRADLANPIEVVHDGQEAMDYLFGTDDQPALPVPGLVLLDLKLPRVGGLDVLSRVRAEPRTRLIPVVVLSGSTERRDRADAYRLGANSFVTKPIEFDDFARAIRYTALFWLTINEPPAAPGIGDERASDVATPQGAQPVADESPQARSHTDPSGSLAVPRRDANHRQNVGGP